VRPNRYPDVGVLVLITFGVLFGSFIYFTLIKEPTHVQFPGTLICMEEHEPTVQLYSSDVHYTGNGAWTLKRDGSGQYTTYVKAEDESCVVVPGKEAPQLAPAKPQPKVPPTTAYITPAPYVET